jgi:hypothetical protein
LYYRLVGIECSRTIGEQVPGFWDFFNFQVGDVFEYIDRYELDSMSYGPFTRYTILVKSSAADTLSYTVQRAYAANQDYWDSGLETDTIRSLDTITISYQDSAMHATNMYPNQLAKAEVMLNRFEENIWIYCNHIAPIDSFQYYVGGYLSFDSAGRVTKTINLHFRTSNNSLSDTLFSVPNAWNDNYDNHVVYKQHLGRTNYAGSDCFESFFSVQLIAFRIADDSAGHLAPLNLFLPVEKVQTGTFFRVSNLVYETIQLELMEPASLQLFNLQGGVVLQLANVEGNQLINVSSLPAGLYIVELISGNKAYRQKLIKL